MSSSRLSTPLPAFLLLIGLLVLQLAVVTRVRAEQDVCPFDGGSSLRVNATKCPTSAPISCGSGLQPRCCPSGTQCAGEGLYLNNYCCSTDDSTNASIAACIDDIVAYPRCAVSTWTLFDINGTIESGAWCCLKDNNGTYQAPTTGNGGGVRCVDAPDSDDEDPPDDLQIWAVYVEQETCTSASASASSSTTATATDTASATTSSAAATSTAAAASGSKISGGAIAGIVIGCVAGIGLLAAAAFFVWRRQHAKKADVPVTPQDPGAYSYAGDAKYEPVHQSTSPPIELGTTHYVPPPVELGAPQYATAPVELDSSPR